MRFARIVFNLAGIYGLLVIVPQYFLEAKNGRDYPPVITHPEYYYGFIGVTLAWQIMFLIIARDPQKYRLAMLAAMIEKFSFVIAAVVLLMQNRIPLPMFGATMIDLVLGVLFVVAFLKTERKVC